MDEIAKSAKKMADDLRTEEGVEITVLKNGSLNHSVKTIALKNNELKDNERPYFSFAEIDISIYDLLQVHIEGQLYEVIEIEKQEINNCFVQLKAFYKPRANQQLPNSQENLDERIHTIFNEFDGDYKNTLYKACEILRKKFASNDQLVEKLNQHYTESQVSGLIHLKEGLCKAFGDPNVQPIIEISDKNELLYWLNIFSKTIKKLESYDL